jgi:hypothetical protein
MKNNMFDRAAIMLYERQLRDAQCKRIAAFIRLLAWICVIGVVAAVIARIIA